MSPRDEVLAQRAGFVAGIRANTQGRWSPSRQAIAEGMAETAYPIPTVTRPRIIRLAFSDWKVEAGELWSRCTFGGAPQQAREWRRSKMQRAELRDLLWLFDEPTETVEAGKC